MANYGTVVEANLFFDQRLHVFDWNNATVSDRQKALVSATDLVDQFDFAGQKFNVQVQLDALGDVDLTTDANQLLLRTAELSQELEFPRGDSSVVPTEIEHACYYIAKALLSGREPDADLESLAVKSEQYGGLKTSYAREGVNNSHLAHLIPSPQAFHLIVPFFRERDEFDVKRVS